MVSLNNQEGISMVSEFRELQLHFGQGNTNIKVLQGFCLHNMAKQFTTKQFCWCTVNGARTSQVGTEQCNQEESENKCPGGDP